MSNNTMGITQIPLWIQLIMDHGDFLAYYGFLTYLKRKILLFCSFFYVAYFFFFFSHYGSKFSLDLQGWVLKSNFPWFFKENLFVFQQMNIIYYVLLGLLKFSTLREIIEWIDKPQTGRKYLQKTRVTKDCNSNIKVKVKLLSHVRLFATPWTPGASVHGIF